MVENVHQEGRRHPLFPCMVAKGFAEGMAAYVGGVQRVHRSFFHNAECLGAAEGMGVVGCFCENIVCGLRVPAAPVNVQRVFQVAVQCHDVLFPSLFFL